MIFTLDNYRTTIRIHGKISLDVFLLCGIVEQYHNGAIILFKTNISTDRNYFFIIFFVNSLNKVIYAKLVSKGHQICTFAFQLFSAYFQLNKILKDMIFVHINMILPVLNFRINENM